MKRLPVVADSVLPPLYERWLAPWLGPLPTETLATCSHCTMLPSDAAPSTADSTVHFSPSTKCCTYQPELPNFLVGGALADRSAGAALGRATVVARVEAKIGVSPVGLGVPRSYKARYADPDAFGHDTALRCPHYLAEQGGLCGVWKHRQSACATWFCKHERGARGEAFWRAGVGPLLRAVERALSWECVRRLGFDGRALSALMPMRYAYDDASGPNVEPVRDDEAYRLRWGPWMDREVAFYEACHRIVAPLGWDEVLNLAGPEVRLRAEHTLDLKVRGLASDIPARLVAGAVHVVSASKATVRVASYSPYDALDLPTELFSLLGRFDGRATKTVLRELQRRDGIELDEEELLRLVDFGLLRAHE